LWGGNVLTESAWQKLKAGQGRPLQQTPALRLAAPPPCAGSLAVVWWIRKNRSNWKLPPYSPDWSPIEPCRSNIKTRWRGMKARTRDALDQALAKVINTISNRHARGWFAHCGYPIHQLESRSRPQRRNFRFSDSEMFLLVTFYYR
jgi:hypothetical protein